MTWPLAIDYDAAVQTPRANFADVELASGAAAANMLGLPLTYAGGFANVYKFECGKNTWAVKCFTRQVTDQQTRYAAISEHLKRAGRKFAVEFIFLEQGIRIKGEWFPIVKMRWVEGFTLNEFLRDHAGNAPLLEQLSALWLRLGNELRNSKMAHADLQHGNVMLVPGAKERAIGLRLIDYDGMWVPPLAGRPPGEVGHPNYQHPQRLREGEYSSEIDRFAHLVMFTAFRCLASGGAALWNKHDNSENLLFREADFREPEKSKLWPDLLTLPDAHTTTLVGHLLAASQRRLDQVPLVSDIYEAGKVAQLSPELRELVRDKVPSVRPAKPLGPPPPPVPAPDWLAGAKAPTATARKSRAILTPIPAPDTIPVVSIPPVPLDAIPVEEEAIAVMALPPIPFAPVRAPADPDVPVAAFAAPDAATAADRALARATQVHEVERPREARDWAIPVPDPAAPTAPDWLLGLGLPPDSPIVRHWRVVLGAVVGLPLAAVLLAVWLLWPSPRPAPQGGGTTGPPKPSLRSMAPIELRGGHELLVEVHIENGEPDFVPALQLADLPKDIEGAIVPGDGEQATVRLVAKADVAAGTHSVKLKLFHAGAVSDEKTLKVTTRPLVRPTMGEVSRIDLKQGESKDLVVSVERNGNTDLLALSITPMPAGVRAEALLSPGPNRVGVRLTADADAPAVQGGFVTVGLLADGVLAAERTVNLTLQGDTAQAPKDAAVFLTVAQRLSVEAGGSTKLAVSLERHNFKGPVHSAGSLPFGVTVSDVVVPEGSNYAELTFEAGRNAFSVVADRAEVTAWVNSRRAGRERVQVVVTAAAARPKDKEREKEKDEPLTPDKLRGSWKLVRHEAYGIDGQAKDRTNTAALSLVVMTANQWTFYKEVNGFPGLVAAYAVAVDAGKDPVTVELRLAQGQGSRTGSRQGIARIKDKQLEILYTVFPKEKPTSFDKPPVGAQLLILSNGR